MAKRELLTSIRDRCRESSRKDKSRILDEFIAVTGHHRKHGIRLLAQSAAGSDGTDAVKGRRIYGEAVREVAILIWEASDRICGKRLQAAMPHLVESMERHDHLNLDAEVRARARGGQRRGEDEIHPTPGRLGSGGVAAPHQGVPVSAGGHRIP